MATISDDDIIKKRLLIDGEGGNDDKRITNLMRSFIRWCNSNETPEENHLMVQRMMASLAQCDHSIAKSAQVYKMNLTEQANYESLNKQIEQKIKEVEEKIAECKNELQQAKRVRRHRQEYDSLAKVIQQHPDRQDTANKLKSLDADLATLKENNESLDQKLDMRRKQFHVLVASIHELQRILDDDDNKLEEDGNTPAEMDTS